MPHVIVFVSHCWEQCNGFWLPTAAKHYGHICRQPCVAPLRPLDFHASTVYSLAVTHPSTNTLLNFIEC